MRAATPSPTRHETPPNDQGLHNAQRRQDGAHNRADDHVVGINPLRARPHVRTWLHRALLAPAELIAPVLVQPDDRDRREYAHLPTAVPLSELSELTGRLWTLGVRSVKVFAYVNAKTSDAAGALSADNPLSAGTRTIRAAAPDMVIATEVCGCAWTDHGECVLLDRRGRVQLGATLRLMADMAIAHAEAGADIIGPAAVLDGSVAAVRDALDASGHRDVGLTPSVIFDSRLFGVYKQAMRTDPGRGHRRGFQIDACHARQAYQQARRWLEEGADSLLVQPAMTSVDVLARLRDHIDVPLTAFSVSGEDQLFAAASDAVYLEYICSLRRAGADMVMTYGAERLAAALAALRAEGQQ